MIRIITPEENKYETYNDIMNKGNIYLLCDHTYSYMKIGKTKDSVNKRISSILTGTPYDIHLIDYYYTSDMKYEENRLHEQFSHLHHTREWYKFDYSIIEEFNKSKQLKPEYKETYIDKFRRTCTGNLGVQSNYHFYNIEVNSLFNTSPEYIYNDYRKGELIEVVNEHGVKRKLRMLY